MEDGDISNRVAPKLWFQLEGLILLPDGDPREVFEHVSRSRRVRIRDHYTPNTFVRRRMWDLAIGRYDFSLAIVTFCERDAWVDVATAYCEVIDLPAAVTAIERPAFYDEVILSPGCGRFYTPEPALAAAWGSKAHYVDSRFDFEPLL